MKRSVVVSVLLAMLFSAAATSAFADDKYEDLSLEQLLDLKLDVASKKALSIRESPGVLTLVSRDEIVSSGARDLVDVLLLVPGFGFGVDVGGVVGIGFRGNWGHEGKILLLFDGQPMNELLYSTNPVGNHYPVDQIERLEIVRGPGSVIYGGYAELAVINVITRGPKTLDGPSASVRYGQASHGLGSRTVDAAFAHTFESGIRVDIAGFAGQGNRSDRVFTDFDGGSTNLKGNSRLDPMFVNGGIGWKDLAVRFYYDGYKLGAHDGYANVAANEDLTSFSAAGVDARYSFTLSEGGMVVTPHLGYVWQQPWRTSYDDPNPDTSAFYEKTVQRTTEGVTGSQDLAKGVNLLVGAEAYQDHAVLDSPPNGLFQTPFLDTANAISFTNVAAFAQVSVESPIANLAVGARVENNSQFGGSFVPRAALTRAFDRAHFKLLYSQAFRTPAIENTSLNSDIKPERLDDAEFEAGYRFSENFFASANLFDITIQNTIVYTVTGTTEGYSNREPSGSRGGELEMHAKYGWGFAKMTYSFYTSAGKNHVSDYSVPGHPSMVLAFPQHKVTLDANVRLPLGLSLAPSAVFLGERYGYLVGDGSATETGLLQKENPILLLNAMLNAPDVVAKDVDLSIGVYNLLDAKFDYIEPYQGGAHAPLPGLSRELVGSVRYNF